MIVLVDRQETAWGLAKQGLAALLCLAMTPLVLMQGGPRLLKEVGDGDYGLALAGLAIMVLWPFVWMFVLWQAIATRTRARAGSLRLPMHPLPQGQTLNVAFTRQVSERCKLVRLSGKLVMEKQVDEDDSSGRTQTVWRECHSVNLGSGGARLVNGEIVAVWQFEVPAPDLQPEYMDVVDGWVAVGTGRMTHHADRRWRFVVQYHVEGLPDDESSFPIQIVRTKPLHWSMFRGWHERK